MAAVYPPAPQVVPTVPPAVQLHTHLNFCVGLDQFSWILSNASHSFLPNSKSKEKVEEVVHGQTNSRIQTGWVVQTHSAASAESPAMNCTTSSTMQASTGNQAAPRFSSIFVQD